MIYLTDKDGDPEMSLFGSHSLGGLVNTICVRATPHVRYVLVHMEPYAG